MTIAMSRRDLFALPVYEQERTSSNRKSILLAGRIQLILPAQQAGASSAIDAAMILALRLGVQVTAAIAPTRMNLPTHWPARAALV